MHHDATLDFTRRAALGTLAALGIAGTSTAQPGGSVPVQPGARSPLSPAQLGWDAGTGTFTLPPLPYPPEALEPHIDAQTMSLHHGKHHASYVRGLNTALQQLAGIRAGSVDAEQVRLWTRDLAFHASGHVNHALFWHTMAPPGSGGGGAPSGELAQAIARDFGSFDQFAKHFQAAANQVQGSGWGWLAYHPLLARLVILQGHDQQNMLIPGAIPLLGVDVWEHAYYLKYQNRRAEYVTAFMNVINWVRVGELYRAVTA